MYLKNKRSPMPGSGVKKKVIFIQSETDISGQFWGVDFDFDIGLRRLFTVKEILGFLSRKS